MLRNFIVATLRNLRKQRGYTFINVFGLATGLAAFMLILLFVQHETSMDLHHEKGDRIYRVILDADIMGQTVLLTSTPMPMAEAFLQDLPEIESATRVDVNTRVLVTAGDRQFYEERFFLVDSTYFDIFTAEIIKGNSRTALTLPNSIVITEDMARKYFGEADPMGRTLNIDRETDYTVTGIVRFMSDQTHFRADFLGSMVTHPQAGSPIWLNNSWLTYVLLKEGADIETLRAKMPDMVAKYVGPDIERFMGQSYEQAQKAGLRYEFALEKMTDIYLHSKAEDQIEATGDIRYVYILSSIALFVLLIACINFMNLSTARAGSRAREVALRKVLGSERAQLIRQFLGEAVITALVSMVIAAVLVAIALPVFESITGASLIVSASVVWIMIGVTLLTGLFSGIYPAFVLSGFRPVDVLSGSISSSPGGSFLRSSLVVFQFAISITLLISTGVVFKQLRFIQDRDIGFQKDQVVVLPVESEAGQAGFESFREELLKNPGVIQVAASNGLPGPNHIHQNTAFRWESAPDAQIHLAALAEVSHEYIQTLGMRIVAGRNFSRDFTTDSEAFLFNEAAAKEFGWTAEEAVGKIIHRPDPEGEDRIAEVVGVFKDANFNSLHSKVTPLILGMRHSYRYIPVLISPENITATVAFLEEKWTAMEPGFPFGYYFMEEDYRQYYEQEERLGSIYSYFSILSILIACLGLFGLASFITSQRTREIGVRKVMGASVTSIVTLLSKEFTLLVVIACVLAFPVSYYIMDLWLQEFAFATTIGGTIFVVAGIAALLIAWGTISIQSIKAARANPVDSLYHS